MYILFHHESNALHIGQKHCSRMTVKRRLAHGSLSPPHVVIRLPILELSFCHLFRSFYLSLRLSDNFVPVFKIVGEEENIESERIREQKDKL